MKIERCINPTSDQTIWKLSVNHCDLYKIALTPQEEDFLKAGPFCDSVSLTLRVLAVIARRIEDYTPPEIQEEEEKP